MSVNLSVRCRYCGTATTEELLESHVAERCPQRRPTRARNDVAAMRSAGAARPGVPRTGEPPTPYSDALEVRAAAAGMPHAGPLQVLRDADGVPKPWSSALAARAALEGR